MSVSGLGSTPARRPAYVTPPRTVRPVPATESRNDLDSLTAADREMIFQVTGQRIVPGLDVTKVSRFAATIAADRVAGRLAPGQEVTAVYLKDLERRYARAAGPNPISPHLDEAVGYLARSGARRIDVTA